MRPSRSVSILGAPALNLHAILAFISSCARDAQFGNGPVCKASSQTGCGSVWAATNALAHAKDYSTILLLSLYGDVECVPALLDGFGAILVPGGWSFPAGRCGQETSCCSPARSASTASPSCRSAKIWSSIARYFRTPQRCMWLVADMVAAAGASLRRRRVESKIDFCNSRASCKATGVNMRQCTGLEACSRR